MLEACRANRHTLLFLRWFNLRCWGYCSIEFNVVVEFNVSEEDVRREVV